jgi:hypothetical protein
VPGGICGLAGALAFQQIVDSALDVRLKLRVAVIVGLFVDKLQQRTQLAVEFEL